MQSHTTQTHIVLDYFYGWYAFFNDDKIESNIPAEFGSNSI